MRIVTYVVDAEPAALVSGPPVGRDVPAAAFPTVPDRSVVVPMFAPST